MPLQRNGYHRIKGELPTKRRLARGPPSVDARRAYRHRARTVTAVLELDDVKGRAHAMAVVLAARLLPLLDRPEVAWATMLPEAPYNFAVRRLTEGEGGGYLIELSDLPGCEVDGEAVEEAIVNGVDAMRGWIAAMQVEGLPLSALVRASTA